MGAQTFTFGLKGGGLFTNPAERLDRSDKYIVGPSVEVGLGSRFGIEADALYSRFGSTISGLRTEGNSWEFPVMGKYYFANRDAVLRPFAGGGASFRNIWLENVRGIRGTFGRDIDSTDPAVGAVVGGGVAFKLWKVKLSPEVRYTRWGGFNYPATNANQVQGLLGLTF